MEGITRASGREFLLEAHDPCAGWRLMMMSAECTLRRGWIHRRNSGAEMRVACNWLRVSETSAVETHTHHAVPHVRAWLSGGLRSGLHVARGPDFTKQSSQQRSLRYTPSAKPRYPKFAISSPVVAAMEERDGAIVKAMDPTCRCLPQYRFKVRSRPPVVLRVIRTLNPDREVY